MTRRNSTTADQDKPHAGLTDSFKHATQFCYWRDAHRDARSILVCALIDRRGVTWAEICEAVDELAEVFDRALAGLKEAEGIKD